VSEFIEINTKEIDQLLRHLKETVPARMPAVIASYCNNLAFAAKEETTEEMKNTFDYRRSSTRKMIERGLYVEKASHRVKPIESEVGVLHPSGSRGQFMARTILARQFGGGDVKQYNRGMRERRALVIDVRAARSAPVQIAGKAYTYRHGTPKQQLGRAVDRARRAGKEFAITSFGVSNSGVM